MDAKQYGILVQVTIFDESGIVRSASAILGETQPCWNDGAHIPDKHVASASDELVQCARNGMLNSAFCKIKFNE